MPLYMDIHTLPNVTEEDAKQAHFLDLDIQDTHGVRFLKYWFNERAGKSFCLVDAPNPEAAARVHKESHGFVAHKIIEVDADMISQFLDTGHETPDGAALVEVQPAPVADGGIRAILFTDIVDSTALTNRVGDAAAMDILRAHNEMIRGALTTWNGREVKHTGDGIMVSFVSPSGAVNCAMEIQRGFAHERGDGEDSVSVRIGLSAGEPVEESDDIFGVAVQLAARTCGECQPNRILVSNVILELCVGKGFTFHDRGEVQLKGFDQPVRLHEVAWTEESG